MMYKPRFEWDTPLDVDHVGSIRIWNWLHSIGIFTIHDYQTLLALVFYVTGD